MPSAQLRPVIKSSTVEIMGELLCVDVEHGNECSITSQDCHGTRLDICIDGRGYEFGVISKLRCARKISRAMLGLDENDEPLSGSDLTDAIGELANMIAGRIKGKLSQEGGAVALSTPESVNFESVPAQRLRFHNSNFEFSVFLKPLQA